ncbi:hypothetical protein [Blautia sp. Marseille-P3201T]|uniref:hypothetical protein n=1 Tax=Blautia sp. Marseille-P3201T TaxID=1907659 RepID=UPI0009305948|nr:hypothetical protein [Blautia sp. Marseille-P3201T]
MKENMMENRLQNLLWTVSEDYNCDVKINPADLQKSPEIAFYNMILQGAFQKYFDAEVFETYMQKKIQYGAEPSVLFLISKLCIDSAVCQKVCAERKGIENIRRKAFRETLKKDAFRFSHTDWDYLEYCYLEFQLYQKIRNPRLQPLLLKIAALSHTNSIKDVCKCIDEVYHTAYEKGFAEYFKGISRDTNGLQSGTEDSEETKEQDNLISEEDTVNIFSGHVDAQDNGKQDKSTARLLSLDKQSSEHLEKYIELNYGKSILPPNEKSRLQKQMCTGIHEDCRLHITKGVLHNQTENNAKTDYVKRIKEENLHIYKKNFLLTRQNILSLSNLLKRALLTRTERELCTSEYGTICPEKLWNLGRTDNSMLFKRELLQDNSDFAVEVLIDASGSQQRRQSLVALQGFIISRALSLAEIPHRVTGFCTFGSYTILNEYRDYLDNSDADENIFEFYGSANNRDGLAIRAAADSLDKQPQENKILIVLSDGNPNDIIAANSRQKAEKQPYCLDFAVKDTATEVRRLRNRKISVLGVFAGEEEDLQAEKKIFGKDFAYIHDISNFANIVGHYLKKQITD